MNRVRNGVVIIILCIIGAMGYNAHKKNNLSLGPSNDSIRDAVAQNNASGHKKLNMSNQTDDNLKDALAEHPAIPTGLHNGPHGNTEDQTPPPPRGGEHHGNNNFGNPNPGQQLPPQNPPPSDVSPSAPPSQID